MGESITKQVLDKYPHCHKSNTEVCIYVWEEVAKRKGFNNMKYDPMWIEMKQIIRDHKPEMITRERRKLVAPTPKQAEKEQEMWQQYAD